MFNSNINLLTLFNNVQMQRDNAPSLENINFTPIVIISVVLMTVSIMLPCLIWFLRNFTRIVLKKNYEWLNKSLKWILLFSLFVFILSIILIILASKGII